MIITKTVTTVTGIAQTPQGNFVAEILSKDPIRSIVITNISSVNLFVFFGEEAGQSADAVTIPPSTAFSLDPWDLEDEDIHAVVFVSVSTASASVAYKASPRPPYIVIQMGEKKMKGTISA